MDDTVGRHFENELEAARVQLEAPGRRVLIVGVVAEDGGLVSLARSTSQRFSRGEAITLAAALRKEANRIESKAVG